MKTLLTTIIAILGFILLTYSTIEEIQLLGFVLLATGIGHLIILSLE